MNLEFDYTAYLEEKYKYEKEYSKRMEASSLLAHSHIGRLYAIISFASIRLSDSEKEEIKKDLAQMDKEREDFDQNYKSETNK
jgi:hypothetical protein